MNNDITALRKHLFDTLEALKDKDHPMDITRAKAITGVAQVLINSAKVEVEFIKATDSLHGSGFLDQPKDLPTGITGSTVHRLKG